MIHQPLPNSKGGTIEAINYMCNERLKDGTARVLRGNPNLTKKLFNLLNLNKNSMLVYFHLKKLILMKIQKY